MVTHRPTPYFIKQSFRIAASSFVQPGDGVKFHLRCHLHSSRPIVDDLLHLQHVQDHVSCLGLTEMPHRQALGPVSRACLQAAQQHWSSIK